MRLRASTLYPIQSPMGADIIVFAHEHGINFLWRGGKQLSARSRQVAHRDDRGQMTRSEWNAPVSIHEVDSSGQPLVTHPLADADLPSFEDDEQESPDDEPSVAFVQELNLSLGSPVLDIAVPPSPQTHTLTSAASFDANIPLVLQANIVLVATCADGSVKLVTLPLVPPTAAAKLAHTLSAQICDLIIATPSQVGHRHAALSWTSGSAFDLPNSAVDTDDLLDPRNQQLHLLVALSGQHPSSTLDIYRIPASFDPIVGGLIPSAVHARQTLHFASSIHKIAFNASTYPSPKHSQLLMSDAKGFVNIYDLLAADSSKSRPSSRESLAPSTTSGAWLASFSSPFSPTKSSPGAYPALSQRKKILDAHWLSSGRSVLILLGDGEWGIWHISGSSSSAPDRTANLNQFAVGGFVGEVPSTEPAVTESRTRAKQRLAPMTPNTRKSRQQSLFSGSTTTNPANALRGGVSVETVTSGQNAADDSIVLWFGGEVYHMPSLAAYMQRSSGSGGRDVGALYGPGLTRIEGLDLCGEILNDVVQLPIRGTAGFPDIATHKDILITGEYRLTVISTDKALTPTRSIFARDAGSSNTTFDLQLLEKGELDIGGVDRLLDGMDGADTNVFGRARRVGFVH